MKHQEGRGFDSGSLLNPRDLEQELVNTKLPKFCGGKQLGFIIIILPPKAQLLSENPSLLRTRYLDIMLPLWVFRIQQWKKFLILEGNLQAT